MTKLVRGYDEAVWGIQRADRGPKERAEVYRRREQVGWIRKTNGPKERAGPCEASCSHATYGPMGSLPCLDKGLEVHSLNPRLAAVTRPLSCILTIENCLRSLVLRQDKAPAVSTAVQGHLDTERH